MNFESVLGVIYVFGVLVCVFLVVFVQGQNVDRFVVLESRQAELVQAVNVVADASVVCVMGEDGNVLYDEDTNQPLCYALRDITVNHENRLRGLEKKLEAMIRNG